MTAFHLFQLRTPYLPAELMTVHFYTVSTINLSNIVNTHDPVSDACGLEAKTFAGQFHIVRSA
jgi:hypothetical protein